MESYKFAKDIAQLLSDKKGEDISIINLMEKSILADYFVVASANSVTAIRAMADYVDEMTTRNKGLNPLRRDGINESKWVAIDYGTVVVHIFHKETREYYQLERLWENGENIEKFGD